MAQSHVCGSARTFRVPLDRVEPYTDPLRWRDIAEMFGATVVFLSLFLGLPFLLWLVLGR